MGSRVTKYDLDNVTDYIQFEFFCNNLMSAEGYKSIEPMGRNKDRGRDAIDIDKGSGEVTIFTYSVREDWNDKLDEDLGKIKKHGHACNKVVFLTTGSPTTTEKDNKKKEVKKEYGWDLEFYDLERIATLVDTQNKDLRALHPDLFFVSSCIVGRFPRSKDLDRKLYAESVLRLHEEWLQKYTPLVAAHREVDAFAFLTGSAGSSELFVGTIPAAGTVSVLLGESGGGKTTAVWRIAVEASREIIDGKSEQIPILLSLRSWTPTHLCRDLVQDRFDLLEVSREAVEQELAKGNCLLLIDGLNEVRESLQTEAYQELIRFLNKYEKNSVLICCRTSAYEPRMLEDDEIRKRLRIYEIRRMGRDQITEYIDRHFVTDKASARDLLSKLGIDDDDLWEAQSSLIQLARIPLYLRLFIIEYERSRQLPTTEANLIRVLIDRILEREKSRESAKIDNHAKERLLSSFAYEAVNRGYWLELPESHARDILQKRVNVLKDESLIDKDLTVGAAWQEIISNNLLTSINRPSIQWLHQLICDYFLGCEINQIWTVGTETDRLSLIRKLSRYAWGLPCEVALSLLDRRTGAKFLEQLIMTDGELARRAFESQNEHDQKALTELLISETIKRGDPDTAQLNKIAVNLPSQITVQTLIDQSKTCAVEMDVPIAKAVSALVIEHGPVVIASRSGFDLGQVLSERRLGIVTAAVKRAINQLMAWTNSRNDFVSLYAAKGLWEFERGLAAETLRRLLNGSHPEVVSSVKDVMEELGAE